MYIYDILCVRLCIYTNKISDIGLETKFSYKNNPKNKTLLKSLLFLIALLLIF